MVSEQGAALPAMWCYLAEVGGHLLALPDDDRTVLLPYISAVPQVTALPSQLTPPYLLGLVNIAQRGELLVDLAGILALQRPSPLERAEARRMVVYTEGPGCVREPYRLALAVDAGYELAEATVLAGPAVHPLGSFVRQLLVTQRGTAALIEMEMVCNKVLHDLGASRLWNEPDAPLDEESAAR